jgi:plasmid stability protein
MGDEVVGRVYAIRRADDFVFRYVGQTRHPLSVRLQRHRQVARAGRLTPFYSWLRKHMAEDIAIDEFEIIETNREALGTAEQFWISHLRANDQPLLNISAGGLGPTKVVWSPAQREAARQRSLGRPGFPRFGAENPFYGKRHSAQQREAWSTARKGSNSGAANPNFGKFGPEHPSFGAIRSEETREILSAQKRGEKNPNFGKRATDETRAKMSAARSGVPMPTSVRSAHTRHHTNQQIWKASCKHCAEIAAPHGFTVKP